MSPSIVASTSCELTTAPANDEQSACVVCAVLPARSVREGSTSAARRASMPQRSTSAQSTRCATLCLLRDRRGERARAGAHVVLERLSWRHLRRRQDGRGISPAASGTSGWDGMGAPGTFGCSSAVVRGEQGGCQHLLSAPVRTCWHRQSNIAFPKTGVTLAAAANSPFAGGARSAAHEACSAPEAVACHRPEDIQTSKMVRRRLIQHELRAAAKGCGRFLGASASTATLSAARIAARRTARALRDRRSPVPS